MTDTAARLDAYYAAEARALEAQQSKKGDRWRINAELETIRQTIKELQAQVAAEQRAACGQVGPAFALADFSSPLR